MSLYLKSDALLATSGLQLRCLITVDSSRLRRFFKMPCLRLVVAGSTTLGENVTGGVCVVCGSVFSSAKTTGFCKTRLFLPKKYLEPLFASEWKRGLHDWQQEAHSQPPLQSLSLLSGFVSKSTTVLLKFDERSRVLFPASDTKVFVTLFVRC